MPFVCSPQKGCELPRVIDAYPLGLPMTPSQWLDFVTGSAFKTLSRAHLGATDNSSVHAYNFELGIELSLYLFLFFIIASIR